MDENVYLYLTRAWIRSSVDKNKMSSRIGNPWFSLMGFFANVRWMYAISSDFRDCIDNACQYECNVRCPDARKFTEGLLNFD